MNAVDPEREKVERTDEVVRETQEQVIDDPTVFVKGAALGALTLIALARLGQAKADPRLRGFADRVRRNQEALRAELAAIAGRKKLDVPAALIYPDEQMLAVGGGKSGAEFDAWYSQQLFAEHLKATTLYEAAKNMKDPQLAQFAGRTLPRLEADRAEAGALRTP